MARLRHRVGEILVLHGVRRLLHRRAHEPLAAPGRGLVVPGQFHDAQQLVTQPRESPPQQPRGIFQATLAPDPPVPFQRHPKSEHRAARAEQHQTQPARRLANAVQREDQQVRQHDAEDRGEDRLGKLDDPDAPPEVGELRFEHGRE